MNKLKILIVDDNLDLADCLEVLLSEQGYDIKVAYDGENAMLLAQEMAFDLAIVDIKLPGMHGIDVLRKIRKLNPEIEGIVMTGYQMDQILALVSEQNTPAILRKPVQPAQICDKIAQYQGDGLVLVADDSADASGQLGSFLKEKGYSVCTIRDKGSVPEMLIKTPADILVLDMKIPVLACLETYLELREQGFSSTTVIITGYSARESDNIDVLRSISVTGCLYKPFNPVVLLEAVANIAKNHMASRISTVES